MPNLNNLVSVIITTKNEEEVIQELIASIKNQTYQNFEIILVDNNSSDKTAEIAKMMGVTVYAFGPERSAQRNFGAKKSKGDDLLFLDADMELDEEVIEDCMKTIKRFPKVGALSIPERSSAVTFWEKVKSFERSFYNDTDDSSTDAARFFPKKVFMEVGGYDETITGPEDWDLSDNIRKKGYPIARIKARITHKERVLSLLDLAKKKFYYGLRVHRYLTKHKESTISSRTIYFLRPVFYKNFQKLLAHPILSVGMVIMLSVELLAGGLGYLVGRTEKI